LAQCVRRQNWICEISELRREFPEPFDPAREQEREVGLRKVTPGNTLGTNLTMKSGLIELLGGDQQLVAKLDAHVRAKVDPKDYADVEDIAGMIGQYIHGNEPSHHLAYLYNYAGQPWRTQERLTQIVKSQYKPEPDGLVVTMTRADVRMALIHISGILSSCASFE